MIKVSSYVYLSRSSFLYESNKGVSNLNKSISLKEIYVLQYPAKNCSLQWLPPNLNYNSKFFALVFIFINAN